MNGGTVGLLKRIIFPENVRILCHDSLVSFDIDALLEELEYSTLWESDEYSNTASPPLDQHSRKESNHAETSSAPSVPDDSSPFPVTFHLLEYLEYRYLSAFLEINCILHKMMQKENHISKKEKRITQ